MNIDNFERFINKYKDIILSIIFFIFLIYTIIFKNSNQDYYFMVINILLILIIFVYQVIVKLIKNTNTNKYITIFTSILFFILLTINILFNINFIKTSKPETIKDFINYNLSNVLSYGSEHGIEIDYELVNSDNYPKYIIISQDVKEGTLISKVNKIKFLVSDGPNYDKLVIIPNMVGWKSDEVLKFIKDNHLVNVDASFIKSDIDANTVIEQNIKGEIKRSDYLKIILSRGINDIENKTMKNLINFSLFEATFYLKMDDIKYEIKYEFSDNVTKGYVISQSIDELNSVSNDDVVILTISKGKEIVVVDLKNMSIEDIIKWVMNNNLRLVINDKYDDSTNAGDILEVSHKVNDIIEESTTISILSSKGKLVMNSFSNLNDFRTWADKYSINYTLEYENNDEVSIGDIIRFSHSTGSIISNNDTVIVYISKGGKVLVPNLVDLSKSSALKKCNETNVNCTFVYSKTFSNKVADTVLSQSINSNTSVDRNTSVVLTLSIGSGISVPNFYGMDKNSIINKCNSISINCNFVYGGYNNAVVDTAINQSVQANTSVFKNSNITITLSKGQAKSFTLNLQGNWFMGGSTTSTINALNSNLSSLYPDVMFNIIVKPSNSGPSGGFHPDSPTKTGVTITQGKTYEIWIKQ